MADHQTFTRFDLFNQKYSPFRMAQMRTIFLKSNNNINGRFFSELTRELLDKHEREQTVFAEYRVSIYGRRREVIDSYDVMQERLTCLPPLYCFSYSLWYSGSLSVLLSTFDCIGMV